MSRSRKRVAGPAVAFLLFLATPPALAHHGKDFLLAESCDLPHRGDLYLVATADSVRDGGESEEEVSPALLVGIAPRFAVELHGHLGKVGGEGWRYEATAPSLHIRLTSPRSEAPWSLGLSVEREIANRNDENDRAEARLIATRKDTRASLTLNLIGEREEGGGGASKLSYAAGLRPGLGHRFGWGLEAKGRIEHDAAHEVLVGFYSEPTEELTLKIGLGTGLGPGGFDLTVRTGLVWRF